MQSYRKTAARTATTAGINEGRLVMALLLAALMMAVSGTFIHAAPNQLAINVDASGNALAGYDSVAYFTVGKASKGRSEFHHTWRGARWLFANAEHRDLFANAPESYAPRIGGFCAVGAVNGQMQEVDPEMWLIVRGRLYLYFNASVRDAAKADQEARVAAAERGWETLKPAD